MARILSFCHRVGLFPLLFGFSFGWAVGFFKGAGGCLLILI